MILAHRRRGGAELGDFLEQVVVRVEEEGDLRSEVIDEQAGLQGGLHVGDGIGEREGDFLHGGGAGFADVIAADRDGVPTGDLLRAVLEDVGDEAHGGRGRKDVGAAGDVFLEDVVLNRAAQLARVDALLLCHGDIHGQQDGGGRVDGHGGGDLVERDVLEEGLHVVHGGDGDADLADFAVGDGVVGVVADLRGEVEGDGEAGLTVLQQIAIALVGLFGAGEAGILAHGPEAGAIHGGLDAAGEGVFAGEAELVHVVGVFVFGERQARKLEAGGCLEAWLALWILFERRIEGLFLPTVQFIYRVA